MLTGSCLCGAVHYETAAEPAAPSACHCTQCRKQSGHVWASSYVADADLTITGDVRWFQSSDKAKRGFCPTCGSALFWKHDDDSFLCFSAGSINGPTGLRLKAHIFTADKGDYYDIADDAPQKEH